jgi:subtilase family serine protease
MTAVRATAALLIIAVQLINCINCLRTEAFYQRDWVALDVQTNETSNSSTFTVEVLVALQVKHADVLYNKLKEVSDPRSVKYGSFLSYDEIAEISSPKDEDFSAVLSWLNATGLLEDDQMIWNKFKDMITIEAPVEVLETVFGAKLKWHGNVNDTIVQSFLRAATPIIVPPEIQPLLSFISLNIPIFTNNPAKPRIDVKPYPPKGYLKVWGTGDGALVRFSFYCWNATMASPICDRKYSVQNIDISVTDVDNNYPSHHYEIPYEELTCTHLNKTGKNRLPCDALNSSAAHYDCQCAAIVGPLPPYKLLDMYAKVFAKDADSGKTVVFDIGKTPQSAVLLDFTTPKFLRQIYNIPSKPAKNGATMATIEFVESFDNEDIELFMKLMGEPKASIPDNFITGDFGNTPSIPGGEALLDVEYMLAIAPGASLTFYSISDCYPYCRNEGYLHWLFYLGKQDQPETVQSLSYGSHEIDATDPTSPGALEMLDRMDFEFMKFGLMGVTIVVSSGDNGVCAAVNDRNPKGCDHAVPEWPVTSPFVTGVGATQLSDRYSPVCGSRWSSFFNLAIQCSGAEEVACQSDQGCVITTGGGFSNHYPRPWYQNKAVEDFLEVGPSYKGYPHDPTFFNKNGRAYPDVAVFGSSYATIMQQSLIEFCGTSASAPFFAAIVTMLNDRLLEEGLAPVGFLNPLLYYLSEERPEVFHDITMGYNACRVGQRMGVTPLDCNDQYFTAVAGWDPVTGLGSVDFELLAEAVVDIQKQRKKERDSKAPSDKDDAVEFPYVLPMLDNNKPGMVLLPYVLPMLIALAALGVSIKTLRLLNQREGYSIVQ